MAKKEQFWTEKETALFKKLYPTSICLEDLLKNFPNRTASSLAHKASKLGIKKGKYIPKTRTSSKWTVDEINFLKHYYGQVEDAWIQENMPHRSISSIKKIICKHKPKKKRKRHYFENPSWTEFEDKQLLKYYKTKSTDELTKIIPNRTYDAIRAHLCVLGLRRDKEDLKRAKPSWRWTDKELSLLNENASKPIKFLKELLPVRTQDSIRSMLKRL